MSEDVSGRLLQLAEQLEEEAASLSLRALPGLEAGNRESDLLLGSSAGRLAAAERLRALAAELFEPEQVPNVCGAQRVSTKPYTNGTHLCELGVGHDGPHKCGDCAHRWEVGA